jgi:23S rRNA pseudouridine2605 synthase
MPRDNSKNNDSSRGRRDRPGSGKSRTGGSGKGHAGGGKGRSGAARGPEKKFAKRGFGGKSDGEERRSFGGKPDRAEHYEKKPYEKKAYSGSGKPYAGKRDDSRPPRRHDGDAPPPRGDRPFADRPQRFNRDDRPRDDKRPYTPRGERGDARPAGRFSDRKFGDKKPYTARDGGGEKRPYTPRGEGFRKGGDRPDRKFGNDRKFARDDSKPWQKRDAGSRDDAGHRSRPSRDGARSFDKPKFDRPRYDKPRDARPHEERGGDERPRFSRPREDHPRDDRPRFDRPREGRNAWQEHPRSEGRSSGGFSDRPRRDNEDDSKVFAKRPAFGGRGAYRERTSDERRPPKPPRVKKSGERIAKVVSRAGLASRRDAEEWIMQGRVTVNGRVINSPALDVTVNDAITVDGKPLPPRERTRLFLFHKPRGLMTTHADPEGRPTVFDNLPEGLPRLISIGRLDFNTEGLLLLTNDGGLARALELPDTGWLRRYRVRAHGEVTQAQLDELKKGVEVDGVKYGSIDATLERDQGANVWLVFAIREGKNREVRNVMAHLGLEVNRLIRVSYGPFQLAELAEGEVEEVRTRVLREQLGEKIATLAGADFNRPMPGEAQANSEDETADAPRGKKPFKPAGKSALISDRKGRRVLVQRTGSEEARARNEAEANGYGPPRRPQRGYHGKRDLKPRDE